MQSFTEKLPPERLLALCGWLIVVLLLFPMYLRIAWVDPVDFQRGGLGAADFKAYYIGAQLLVQGENPYDTTLQTEAGLGLGLEPDDTFYFYPTLLAIAVSPLTLLSLDMAAIVWNTINILLLGAIIYLITLNLNLRERLAHFYPWFILLFAISAPTFTALRIGQANILTLFLVLVCIHLERKERSQLAAIVLAVATLLKLFPAVLLLWYAGKRQWKPIVVWTLAVALLIVVPAILLGLSGRDGGLDFYYFIHVLPNLSAPSAMANQSLIGVLNRFNLSAPVLWLLHIALSLLIVLGTVFAFLRALYADRYAAVASILLTASLLLVTITWTTTFIFLIIPFALLLAGGDDKRYWLAVAPVLLIAYLLLSGVRLGALFGTGSVELPLLSSTPFFGAFLLWSITVIFLAWDRHSASYLSPEEHSEVLT